MKVHAFLNDSIVIEIGDSLVYIIEGKAQNTIVVRVKGDVELQTQGRCHCGKAKEFAFKGKDVLIQVQGGCETENCDGQMPKAEEFVKDTVLGWLQKTGRLEIEL